PRAPPPRDALLARSRAAGRREHGADRGSLRRRGGLADRRAALPIRVSARGPAGRRGGHARAESRDGGLTAAADRRDPHRALKRQSPRPAEAAASVLVTLSLSRQAGQRRESARDTPPGRLRARR